MTDETPHIGDLLVGDEEICKALWEGYKLAPMVTTHDGRPNFYAKADSCSWVVFDDGRELHKYSQHLFRPTDIMQIVGLAPWSDKPHPTRRGTVTVKASSADDQTQ